MTGRDSDRVEKAVGNDQDLLTVRLDVTDPAGVEQNLDTIRAQIDVNRDLSASLARRVSDGIVTVWTCP